MIGSLRRRGLVKPSRGNLRSGGERLIRERPAERVRPLANGQVPVRRLCLVIAGLAFTDVAMGRGMASNA
jgi:hypothetical protein